jgi:hypothetical protein
MADRVHDLVVGLQRMAEGARARSDDLRYIQQRDTEQHLEWLNELLRMVEQVRSVLLEERQAFMPTEHPRMKLPPEQQHQMPRVVAKGPKEAAG